MGTADHREEIEARVASTARIWRASRDSDDPDAPTAAERQFTSAVEGWIASLLPEEAPWCGRWYDGLLIADHHVDEDERLSVCGWIYRIDTQTRYPFRARLTLRGPGLGTFEVVFGDARAVDGHRRTGGATFSLLEGERDWMFRFAR